MKLFKRMKDGGPDSPVIGFFLVEIKSIFSIVFLHFGGTREAYHSHAFNAVTLWLRGCVREDIKTGQNIAVRFWSAGDIKYTSRGLMHKVIPVSDAWALSFRGPWAKTWREYSPQTQTLTTLTHGRKVVGQ